VKSNAEANFTAIKEKEGINRDEGDERDFKPNQNNFLSHSSPSSPLIS
jgi:hypothetical protein